MFACIQTFRLCGPSSFSRDRQHIQRLRLQDSCIYPLRFHNWCTRAGRESRNMRLPHMYSWSTGFPASTFWWGESSQKRWFSMGIALMFVAHLWQRLAFTSAIVAVLRWARDSQRVCRRSYGLSSHVMLTVDDGLPSRKRLAVLPIWLLGLLIGLIRILGLE